MIFRASRLLAVLLLAILLAGGCATSPPSRFHTLSALPLAPGGAGDTGPAGAATAVPPLLIALGPMRLPAYLDRPQVVTRQSANRLAIDDFERWGGSLQDDFARVWGQNLTALPGGERLRILPAESRETPDLRLTAEILAFEGQPDGQAVLRVRWSLLDPRRDRPLSVHEGQYARPLALPGDSEALVAALSAALGDFSRAVSEVLRGLPVDPG